MNGVAISPADYTLYSQQAQAVNLMAQFSQGAALKRCTVNLSIVNGRTDGEYPQFTAATDGSDILLIEGSITDDLGNIYAVEGEVVGEYVNWYNNPFTPGQPSRGDTNFKQVVPENNGVPEPNLTSDVAIPGFLKLILGSGAATGRWRPMPA